MFEKFEKVILFPRPFATREHPYDHASELHVADGCLLFSAEQVMLAFAQPGQWYNVALHEYAKAFILKYTTYPWPSFAAENTWDMLEMVSGMPRLHVESVVGLAGIEALPVAIHHYFQFPEKFSAAFPSENQIFKEIFGPEKA